MPGNFHVTINLDNAAFDDDWEYEAVRILRQLADRIRDGQHDDTTVLMDVNGNRVGCAFDTFISHNDEHED